MNTDGLRAILEKEPITPTRLARDFLTNPQELDDLYKHHVRTYIPLQTGSNEGAGVNDYAKRLIKQVKDAKAPRGYITADFGYGKTSAGLFVWQQAQEARLIAVPPFRVNRLEDLLDATAGWVAYSLQKTMPSLVTQVEEIYRFYHDRELETIARRYQVPLEQAQQMYADQTLQLSITPKDIVQFFKQMTELTLQAGFEGLVVIPDEWQQYLEPEVKSGRVDPLVPLFDIVTGLLDLQGRLPFGFLMIITSKELGVINDQRGDLIDRLRGNTLDLRTIYDREFPARLWQQFAAVFDFQTIASTLVDDWTLESLGQIASRQDLSNGPRTVVATFRRIAECALETSPNPQPYSPIDLINDFLNNNIPFDARKILQEVTNRALGVGFIREQTELENAVKLLAAFPIEGATREVQAYYGLADACSALKANGFPEIVLETGDRHRPALALRGLDQAQQSTDELTLILREFTRSYEPQAANQVDRAIASFLSLLKIVFKSEHWTVSNIEQRSLMRNAEMRLIGAFPDMVRRFPERLVHIRVLADGESTIETNLSGECELVFVLHRYFNLSSSEQQSILGNLKWDEESYRAVFDLNLMLPCFDALNRATQDQLRRVMDAEQVNILMILALNEYLRSAAERDSISKPLKEMIQRSMSVRLLEAALDVLFNSGITETLDAAGGRIIEETVAYLIEARYGEQYQTIITHKQWRDNLRNYVTALNQLSSFAQKQGHTVVEGTKEDIAKYFSTTATSFDTFLSRFPMLIEVEGGSFPSRSELKNGRKGGVRFKRHSLEESIFISLKESATTSKREGKQVKAIKLDEIYAIAGELMGYRNDEIDFIIEIMQARDIIVGLTQKSF